MGESIEFYAVDGPYGGFSNHAPHPIKLAGRIWPTVEHYFQAQKFAGTPHEEAIRLASTSQQAAEMGRDRSKPLRADWSQARETLMREALRAKFTQHEDLRRQLLATGNVRLVEHTASDLYWGDGGDGTGKNLLGLMLMELRGELQQMPAGSISSEAPEGRGSQPARA
jgi:ribA/ribD-fused uncharacterized protein